MKLSTLMEGITPDPAFEGFSTNDDYVLAVGIPDEDGEKPTSPSAYSVAQTGITGAPASLNPESTDAHYLRTGKVSVKTGNQRTFAVSGERYIGDAFQEYCLSLKIKFGTGQSVVVPYVYFNMLTGVGEKGSVAIVVNEDQSGDAGSNAGFSMDLKATGKPIDYTYAA